MNVVVFLDLVLLVLEFEEILEQNFIEIVVGFVDFYEFVVLVLLD